MLENFVNQGPCRTNVPVELDLADVTLDRPQDEHRSSIDRLDLTADDGQDVAVGSIFGLKILDDRVETRPRHADTDEIGIERSDRLRRINRDALHPDCLDPHRWTLRQRRRGRRRWYGWRRCDLGLRRRHHAGQRRRYQWRDIDRLSVSGPAQA